MPILYTWGYAQRTLNDLQALLNQYTITKIVDVRRNAWSYNASWRKEVIEKFFGSDRYWHEVSLGNQHKALPWKRHPNSKKGLNIVCSFLEQGDVVLICLEKDVNTCHRLEVAQEIQQINSCQLVHL